MMQAMSSSKWNTSSHVILTADYINAAVFCSKWVDLIYDLKTLVTQLTRPARRQHGCVPVGGVGRHAAVRGGSPPPSTAENANDTDRAECISHPTRVAMEQGDVGGLGSSSASGSLPEGSPPASDSPFNTTPTRGKRRKKKKSGRARAPEQQQEPFCLDVSLPEGQSAAWETIEETDLVARDASSLRRNNRARRTRSLNERDQRDLETMIGLLQHQGRAIAGVVDVSAGLEVRLQRLETWQTEQIESEIEDRLEAWSSTASSPRRDFDSEDGLLEKDAARAGTGADPEGWQEAADSINARMSKLADAFSSYSKNSARMERVEASLGHMHDPAALDGSLDTIATRLDAIEMQLKWSGKAKPSTATATAMASEESGGLEERLRAVRKLPFFVRRSLLKYDHLPRQARERHKKTVKNDVSAEHRRAEGGREEADRGS
jgi:hypothetical protein